ncbi:MAG: hypothetical protein GC154_10800 [bacterium]|nr:hypothetical protein [bacterium]
MSKPRRLGRRTFLQIAATVSAGGSILACKEPVTVWKFFTPEEIATLDAVCERIIPADDYPGASWAGVVNYIDRKVTYVFQDKQSQYRKGLAGVNDTSQALFEADFTALSAEQQDSVLETLSSGKAPGEAWKTQSPSSFFNLVISHAMQGFYGDPRHGGNKDFISWRMLGIPHPPVRARRPAAPVA